MNVALAKAAARRAALATRESAHAGTGGPPAAAAAQAHLRQVLAAQGQGRALSGYLPIRSEIDPVPVMRDYSGPVGVPVIEGRGRALTFRLWQPGGALITGPFGVQIPLDGAPMVPQVLIVPLLAFDAQGYRLGYGGGFYDRTLAGLRALGPVLAVGFAYGAQEVARVPSEATDQRLDAVVTEDGFRAFA